MTALVCSPLGAQPPGGLEHTGGPGCQATQAGRLPQGSPPQSLEWWKEAARWGWHRPAIPGRGQRADTQGQAQGAEIKAAQVNQRLER